jgi:hypothetical protein
MLAAAAVPESSGSLSGADGVLVFCASSGFFVL